MLGSAELCLFLLASAGDCWSLLMSAEVCTGWKGPAQFADVSWSLTGFD